MRSVQRPRPRPRSSGASAVRVVRSGGRALRVGPWPGGVEDVALVTPMGAQPPTVGMIEAALRDVRAEGYRRVLTAALGTAEREPFERARFEPVAWLHLLARSLDSLPPTTEPAGGIRRIRRSEWPEIESIDHRAFAPLWRLDVGGIADARRATPSNRLRVACDHNGFVVGYAVSGRSGDRGYTQRLAVDPGAQGSGVGTALLVDGLRWMRARGAATALINTQVDNERALALYLRLGFELQAERLAVLGRDLTAAG